jgi:hypothetical protein
MVKLLAPKGVFTLKIAGDTGSIVVNGNYSIKLPFEGIYYKDIPLPIKAVSNAEWQFLQWSDGDKAQIKLIHNLEDTLLVQPLYEKIESEVIIEKSIQHEEKAAINNSDNELMLLIGYALIVLGGLLMFVYVVLKITKR